VYRHVHRHVSRDDEEYLRVLHDRVLDNLRLVLVP
jgi:hypothetical protein